LCKCVQSQKLELLLKVSVLQELYSTSRSIIHALLELRGANTSSNFTQRESLPSAYQFLTDGTPFGNPPRVTNFPSHKVPTLKAVGIRYADHATPSTHKGWH
jgi:hypothetical protein